MSATTDQTTLVLGIESAGVRMTPEEFDSVENYDDLYRYELIHGVLVVSPHPLPQETSPNEELGHILRHYRDHQPAGAALNLTLPEQDVRTPDSRRRADRLIWAGLGRVPNVKLDLPTIVVEFVSAGKRSWRRDYEEKKREYMALGISEYWIFDRFRRTMTVFRNEPPGVIEQVHGENDTYRTDRLPGFELPIARLRAEADRVERAQ